MKHETIISPISVSVSKAAVIIGLSEAKLRDMIDKKELDITPVMAGDKQLLIMAELEEAVKQLPRKGSKTANSATWDRRLAA
jgi:hypothetical protein